LINPLHAVEIFGSILIFLQWPALGILFYTLPGGRFIPRWSWLLAFLFLIQSRPGFPGHLALGSIAGKSMMKSCFNPERASLAI